MINTINKYNKTDILNTAKQVVVDEINGIEHMLSQLGDEFYQALEMIMYCKNKIILTGIGKSGHIAKKIAATFASTGTPSFFVHPAEALHGDLGMIEHTDLVIAISYSGEADELSNIIPSLKRKEVKIIGIN